MPIFMKNLVWRYQMGLLVWEDVVMYLYKRLSILRREKREKLHVWLTGLLILLSKHRKPGRTRPNKKASLLVCYC